MTPARMGPDGQAADCIWVLGPVVKRLGALMQSAARYPNIKAGQDFT